MNNKQLIIDKIFNELVKIEIYETNTVIDKAYAHCNYKNNQVVNAIIKKCKNLCLRDYSFDILRDETYASIYEILMKISNKHTEDELVLILNDIHTKKLTITNQFITGIYKLSIFNVKGNLSGNRRDGKKGMIDAFTNIEFTEENLRNLVEVSEDFNEKDTDIIFFLQWFNQNKENFLTPKQLEFLDNPYMTKTNQSVYRKRIYNNTLKAYMEEFNNIENERINKLKSQIKTIENLLNRQDIIPAIKKGMNKGYILDAIIENVNMETMKRFNKGDNSYEVIREFRIALFKKLDELNRILGEW